jgi:hypothetical protein
MAPLTDEELSRRIGSGDWAPDVQPPELQPVLARARRERLRRRTTVGVATAAAAVAAVVGIAVIQPWRGDSVSPTQSANGPSMRPTNESPSPTQPPSCSSGGRLLLSSGAYGGAPQRPTQVVFLQKISDQPCSLMHLPSLEIISRQHPGPGTSGRSVDTSTAGVGPWILRPHTAIVLKAIAAPPWTCYHLPGNGSPLSKHFRVALSGTTWTFRFPGFRVRYCGRPALSSLRIGRAPSR